MIVRFSTCRSSGQRLPPGLALIGLLALTAVSCSDSARPPTQEASEQRSTGDVNLAKFPLAIDRSAQYLAGLCDEQGRFTYRFQLASDEEDAGQYNVLRHAGAVYALAQYCQSTPDPPVHDAMLRAATFLRQQCISAVAGNSNLLAAWSEPAVTGRDEPRQAKLGGAGLALAALLSVEEVEPGFTPIDQLRGLGRFLVFMQKSDGSFYSKFFPESGRSDVWQSMYYPGEATLGLLMLYEKDPAPQWLHTATKALQDLARRGAGQKPTVPDQWYLLSVEHWLPLSDQPVRSCVARQYSAAHTSPLPRHDQRAAGTAKLSTDSRMLYTRGTQLPVRHTFGRTAGSPRRAAVGR